ncbi:MAG TPA: hypothetical protein VF792_06590 [Ktedonobacterales bacterium]
MGGSFVISYSIDDSAFALTMSAINILLGVVATIFAIVALIRERRSTYRGEAKSREIVVRRELTLWGVGAHDLEDETGRELARRLMRLSYWTIMGTGLGWLCANIGLCSVAYAFTSSVAILFSNSYLVLVTEYLFVSIGCALGATFGVYFETRGSPPTTAYSDVRRRRVQDYCAWWLGLAPVASSALAIATLWQIFTQSSEIRLSEGDTYILAPSLPVVVALLVVAALVPVLSALCIQWIVASPRMLLAANPIAAQSADDYRRATAIETILGSAWIASGCLLQAVVSIDLHHYVAHGRTMMANLLSVPFFLGGLICILGGALLFLRGRLGGTLTGWRNPFADMRYLEHGQEL